MYVKNIGHGDINKEPALVSLSCNTKFKQRNTLGFWDKILVHFQNLST